MRLHTRKLAAFAPPLVMLLVLLMAAGLAGCETERRSSPTQLDLPYTATARAAARAQAEATARTWPTEWPTATRYVITTTPLPTRTPFPTRAVDDGTDEPFDNAIVPGEWQTAPFVDQAGEQRRLEEFLGRVVVIHTMGTSCALCVEQQGHLLDAVRNRYEFGQLFDAVIITLGVEARETPALLQDVLSDNLGDQWSIVDTLAEDGVEAEYIVGSASDTLLAALERDFGPQAVEPDGLTVLLIEPSGVAHLMTDGLVDSDEIRDAITFYTIVPDS